MTAHIVVPALDPSGVPATLSKPIITDILRGELGYDGVVITDALTMQGVRDGFGDDRIPVLALKAGVDQLLMPAPGKLDIAYHAVLDAVRSGELTEERIDQSVHRVLQLKMSHGLFKPKNVFVDESQVGSVVGTDAHQQRAQEITDATVTLVKDDANALPLAKGTQKVLVTGASVTPRPRRPDLRPRTGRDGATTPGPRRATRPSRLPWPRRRPATRSSSRPTTPRPAPVSRSWSSSCWPPASRSSWWPCATPTTSRTSPTRRPTSRPTPPPRSPSSRSPGCSSARCSPRACCRSPSPPPATRARRSTRSATA